MSRRTPKFCRYEVNYVQLNKGLGDLIGQQTAGLPKKGPLEAQGT